MSVASILTTEKLSKRFGGLAAVDGVSLDIRAGEVHAIIGPNGAGKTTLLNLLSGEILPTGGRIFLKGRDVTGMTPDQLSRSGLGRSFQHSSIFESFSLRENIRLAAQSRLRSSMQFFTRAETLAEVNAAAAGVATDIGIAAPARLAAEVSHGEQRQLEIAMLMATAPELMLLDEPTSGMGRAETAELIALVRRLRSKHTLVLVEHDMDVVFTLADRITVLVYGSVLATGTPEEVRGNAEVRAAYLGERL
jgi:branched-chain amino acid transport system ATP-binding protein